MTGDPGLEGEDFKIHNRAVRTRGTSGADVPGSAALEGKYKEGVS